MHTTWAQVLADRLPSVLLRTESVPSLQAAAYPLGQTCLVKRSGSSPTGVGLQEPTMQPVRAISQ